jgi:hypothetical protein
MEMVEQLETRDVQLLRALEEFIPEMPYRDAFPSEIAFNEQLASTLEHQGFTVLVANSFVDVVGEQFMVECKLLLRSQELYKILGQMYLCRKLYPTKHRFVVIYDRIASSFEINELFEELQVVVVNKRGTIFYRDTQTYGKIHENDREYFTDKNDDFIESTTTQTNMFIEMDELTKQQDLETTILEKLTKEYALANPLVVRRVIRAIGYNPWETGLHNERSRFE